MNRLALQTVTHPQPPAVDLAGFQSALQERVSGEVRFDRLSRAIYSTDASVYQIVPIGVVVPKSEADVVATVEMCSRYEMPITARGGGTSQAGQAIGPGVVLDFSKYLNRIVEINPAEKWARVEPGCVLDDLNLAAKRHGLQFAPDISTSNRATIGGMAANNSSGTRSVIHGKTIDHILGLKVLLADGTIISAAPVSAHELEGKCARQDLAGAGYRAVRQLAAKHAVEIIRRYPKILRRVGGYNLDAFVPGLPFNLAKMFVGSEGTLGITLEATVRLTELPPARAILVVQFQHLLEALAATPAILQHGPSAVEVIDKYVLDSTRLNPEASRLRSFLEGDPGAILIIEFYGDGQEELAERLNALEGDLRQRGLGYHFYRAVDAAEQGKIWKLRQLALGLSMAGKGDAKALSFVEDTAVSAERLRDYIEEFLGVVARHGTTAGVYAHASVGCLHVRPVVNLKTEAGVKQFERIAADVAELVLSYGGALSGEHGDGLVRSSFQEKMFGPELYQAFREIKRTFDPNGIFNPGKVVDAPPLVSNLRYGPAYVTPEVPTTFDFSADGGIVQAAELCAGVGECRKKREGAMCPSYQATLEEQHSTRGRANALRLALTGQLDLHGLTDPAVRDALDLCLECKACKSECPTNVDMARLKAEFLHQYHRKAGLPWRNRLFGQVAKLCRWGRRAPWLYNWLTRGRLPRWLNDKLLGIDSRRIPPRLARDHIDFTKFWLEAQNLAQPRGIHPADFKTLQEQPAVLIFPDTFTRYFEPEIARATARIVNRLGWLFLTDLKNSDVPGSQTGLTCCGRPMISNGMLDQAVEHARQNVECLFPWASRGKPIIACEPSCLLTIKDDYPPLLRGEWRTKAEIVARQCQTFEEWLEERMAGGGQSLSRGPKKILVQGHCHQRALVGMEPTLRLLRRIPGAEVIDLDCGCCGMAGSFGYETEHYQVSRLVGEQRLFPAIRQAEKETAIVAAGFSCRMQIAHFTGRKACHAAEVMHELLG